MSVDIREIGSRFHLRGTFVAADPYGNGHINDTYLVAHEEGGRSVRYICQRINTAIFKDPVAMMSNIVRVTEHLRGKSGVADGFTPLTVIPARDGLPYHRDAEGHYWRVSNFIDGGRTYEAVRTPEQAYQSARAFGWFQRMLSDLPPPRLAETIPDFHNGPKRFRDLEAAIADDVAGRAASVAREIAFAVERRAIVDLLPALQAAGRIPERITHNDTKFNNVILDDRTGRAISVVDLDTVMPGLIHYDFGDMVRTTTSPAEEDERDLSKVTMQMAMFEALVRGYCSTAGGFLTAEEKRHLAFSGKLITFLIGIRFLTDEIKGDVYFKVARPGHNLDRCRTQFKLIESIEARESAMQRVVERYAS